MDHESRVEEIFQKVVALPRHYRGEVLARLCADNRSIEAEVESLLSADADPASLAPPLLDPDGQAETVVSPPTPIGEKPGEVIGRYKLLQQIGEGGFGVVFMAEQREPVVRKVALKIIKVGMDTRQVIARFEAERQALALMDHPHIARVLDAGATGSGRPYFVMELVTGEPITQYCDRHNLPIADRLELLMQVCAAIQHAHQKGVIHRDIKPTNVLVSTLDGRPHAKMIDFGIAKATNARLTEKTLFTEVRQLIGTPQYMSPEQAEGSLDIDTRTDVYALGVLLYELLTGATPFDPERLRSAAYGEIQRIIREDEPPRPSLRISKLGTTRPDLASHRGTQPDRLGALLRGDLDWIVMKCIEKDRGRRYETANGLAADIQRHLSGEPVIAAPAGAAYRIRKFVRKHRGSVAAGAMIAATLVLGVIGTTKGMCWALDERDRAVQAKQEQSRERERAESAAAAAQEAQQQADAARQLAQASEARAVAEAEKQRGVAKFFCDLLRRTKERDWEAELPQLTTIDDLVNAASQRLADGALADQPQARAMIHSALAKALGDESGESGEAHVLEAYHLVRDFGGDPMFLTNVYGGAYWHFLYDSGGPKKRDATKLAVNADELMTAWSAAIRELEQTRSLTDREAFPNFAWFAYCLGKEERDEEAIALFERLLAAAHESPQDAPRMVSIAAINLGNFYAARGRLAEARAAYAEWWPAFGALLATGTLDDVILFVQEYEFEDIDTELLHSVASPIDPAAWERLLRLVQEVPPSRQHILHAITLLAFSSNFMKPFNQPELERSYLRASAELAQGLPEKGDMSFQCVNGYAWLLYKNGEIDEAEAYIRPAVDDPVWSRLKGPDADRMRLASADTFARCLIAKAQRLGEQDREQAIALLAEAEALSVPTFDPAVRADLSKPERCGCRKQLAEAAQGFVMLYETWNTLAPDAKRSELETWNQRLAEFREASTSDATVP